MKNSAHNSAIVIVTALLIILTSSHGYAQHSPDRVNNVVRVFRQSKDAVVSISTAEEYYIRSNPFSTFGRDPFFDNFFNDFLGNRYKQKSVKTSLGSGVIIDTAGHILTNWHVVQKASSITVVTADDREHEATLIGADPKSDLAVLKIESDKPFSPIPLGNSDTLMIGETVIAIGNPFGLSHTVTTGVISALHRSIKSNETVYENFIQTDASINPGNSGGPLLNINGELVGINTAIYGKAEGIGFAIPANSAKRIVEELVEFGEARPAWIGAEVQDLSSGLASHLGYGGNIGVIVSEIAQNSPADKSGLDKADIIMSIGGKKIKSASTYKRLLAFYTPGDSIPITLFRNGKTKTVTVRAEPYPADYIQQLIREGFGIRITGNTRARARKYGLLTTAGIVITEVRKNAQAHRLGLRPGDIILKAQGKAVDSVDDFTACVIKNLHRDSIVLLVQRGRYGYYVTFDL